jgi:predicted amidohydrolase YtcJ
MRADIILKNANVITMDAGQPSAGLVAITGDKIALVAGNDALDAVSGAKTRVIDCGGRTVVPGFNDAHLHFFSLVQKNAQLAGSGVSSPCPSRSEEHTSELQSLS